MSDLAAILLQRAATAADHERVVAAFGRLYKVTGQHQDRLRALTVYQDVAREVRRVMTNELQRHVRIAVTEAGGAYVRPQNRRLFVGVAPRAQEEIPGKRGKMSPAELARLRALWYQRAQADGGVLPEDRHGLPTRAGDGKGDGRSASHGIERARAREFAAQVTEAWFDRAREDYWRRREALDVWGYYTLEGLTIREIETKTGIGHDKVHRIIVAMRNTMAGRQGPGDDADVDNTGGSRQGDPSAGT